MDRLNKILLIILLSFFVNLRSIEANPNIEARTAILMDYDSNEILYELDPDHEIYPASMTKIMTSIIVFDLLQKNKISLEDKIIISEKAWHMSQSGYSSMFIMPNDEVSIEDLLKRPSKDQISSIFLITIGSSGNNVKLYFI